jgi:CDP-glucose 4,6-dehydratase
VLTPLHGYLLLCERLAEEGQRFASGWNFGPAEMDARPVSWIADKLAASWGEGASWMRDGAAHPAEAQLLRLDASKARAGLDWHPVLPLDQCLLWIIEWYQEFRAGKDLQSLTRRQIERYEYLLQDWAEQNAAARSKKGVQAPLLSTAEA